MLRCNAQFMHQFVQVLDLWSRAGRRGALGFLMEIKRPWSLWAGLTTVDICSDRFLFLFLFVSVLNTHALAADEKPLRTRRPRYSIVNGILVVKICMSPRLPWLKVYLVWGPHLLSHKGLFHFGPCGAWWNVAHKDGQLAFGPARVLPAGLRVDYHVA